MSAYFKALCILIITLFTAGGLQSCVDPEQSYTLQYQGYHVPTPPKHLVLYDVNSYQQSTNVTCGPSVVMTLMNHYGKLSNSDMNQQTEFRIAKEMQTTLFGTSQLQMVAYLRNHGFNVSYGQDFSIDMLVKNINRGVPTIIAWNDFNEHSMLVIGYHAEQASPSGDKDVIFTADPSSSSYIVENGHTINGIDSLSPNQLELNEINARDFFNPSRSIVGMWIVATPK